MHPLLRDQTTTRLAANVPNGPAPRSFSYISRGHQTELNGLATIGRQRMVETVYIARHGFRLSWITSNWSSPTGTARDPPLAAYGEKQSKELAEHFLSMPETERPTAIYCSPFYRCLQTTKPVAAALNLPIYVEHGISEWYNTVKPGTGLLPRPQTASCLRSHFDTIDPSHESLYLPSRKGESVAEHHQRATTTLRALMQKETSPRILLVTHAATAISLIRSLLNDPKLPVRIGCCSLSTIRRLSDGTWKAVGTLGDASFLTNGVERDWGFEDVEIVDGDVVEDVGEGEGDEVDEGPWGLVDHPRTRTISPRM